MRVILLALAAIHFAPLVIVIWLGLFDLVNLKYGQYNALTFTTIIGVLCLLAWGWHASD